MLQQVKYYKLLYLFQLRLALQAISICLDKLIFEANIFLWVYLVGWWRRGMLSVSGDIVYLFSYQQCLIYLSSTSHRTTLQVSQIDRQNSVD